MTDDELIARYIELDPFRPWPGEAVLKEWDIPVWALVGYHFNATEQNAAEVAHDYHVPLEAVEAALAYYRRHRGAVDARIAENTWPSVV